jgi:hypothetical protein
MPAKWAVQAPDGKVIQFPDQFTDQDVSREMAKLYPPAQTSGVMAEDPRAAVGNTFMREIGSMGSTLAGLPGGVYHSFADDPRTPEEQKTMAEHPVLGRTGMGLGRMMVDPIRNASNWYGQAAKGQIPDPAGQALSVAPEAMGQGAGMAVAPELAGKVASIPGSLAGSVSRAAELVGAKTRASNAFNGIDLNINDVPVNHEPVMAAMERVNDLAQKGFVPPKVAGDFTKWIETRGKTNLTPTQGGQIDTPGSSMPLTWRDARDFYTAFNEAINWDEIPGRKGGKMGQAIQQARMALGNELKKTATEQGVGDQYAQALSDYHRAMNAEKAAWGIGKIGGKMAGYGAGGAVGHPWMGGAIGSKMGPGIAGSMVRSITEAGDADIPPSQVSSKYEALKRAKQQ